VFVFGFEHGNVLVIAHLVSFWVGFEILAFVFRRRRKSIAAPHGVAMSSRKKLGA